jgi:hypothetical protein
MIDTETIPNTSYSKAVEYASKGELTRSLDYLEELGCIKELPQEKTAVQIVKDYVDRFKSSKSCILISSEDEVRDFNTTVKAALEKENLLGKEHIVNVKVEKPKGKYEIGDYLYNGTDRDPIGNGEWIHCYLKIADKTENTITFELRDNKYATVDLRQCNFEPHFGWDVYQDATVCVREGERLKLGKSSTVLENESIRQGEIVTFLGTTDQNHIKIKDHKGAKKEIIEGTGCITSGYAVAFIELYDGVKADHVFVHTPDNKEMVASCGIWDDVLATGKQNASIYITDKEVFRDNTSYIEGMEQMFRDYDPPELDETYYAEMDAYYSQTAEQFQKEHIQEYDCNDMTY